MDGKLGSIQVDDPRFKIVRFVYEKTANGHLVIRPIYQEFGSEQPQE
jgi:hypothetical protein